MTPDEMESKANGWDKVWDEFKDNPLLRNIAADHHKNGNASCAIILIEFIESLLNQAGD